MGVECFITPSVPFAERWIINMKIQTRAWIYCCIDAPEDAHGNLKYQKEELYNYAEQMGFTVAGSSQDVGSGLDMNLSGYQKVIQAAEEEKMDALLVKRVDRLGRDSRKVLELIRILEKYNIAIYTPMEGQVALEPYKNLSNLSMKIRWEVQL